MDFRFQKCIRIFKGLTLNLGKSGSSWTVWRPGVSVNFWVNKVTGNGGDTWLGYLQPRNQGDEFTSRRKVDSVGRIVF